MPITGIVVEGGLEFTAQYYLLALVVITIPTLERGPWWRQVEFPFTPEIASLVFLSLSVHDARQGPSVGHTSSNALLSIFQVVPKEQCLAPIGFGRWHISIKIIINE